MGNCLKPLDYEGGMDEYVDPENQTKWRNTSRAQMAANTSPIDRGDTDMEEFHNNAHVGKAEGDKTCLSTSSTSSPKAESSWKRFLHQTRAESVQSKDQDDCSIFGENWEPELFDQRQAMSQDNERLNTTNQATQRNTKIRPDPWTLWGSGESLDHTTGSRKLRLPVLPSTLLGFSPFPTESGDGLEWYRNGELEVPKPDTNSFLIKGKHRITRSTTRPSNELHGSAEACQDDLEPRGAGLYREGWLRYTMFVHQDKTDVCRFHARFRTAKHIFLSLETKTGCELRLSRRLFIYRGKLVRLCVIDGPSRKAIIRCYTSMPTILTKMIISECERPSMLEPQPSTIAPELGPHLLNHTTLAPPFVV